MMEIVPMSADEWEPLWWASDPPIPFGSASWIGMGEPDRTFHPLLLRWSDGPDLLVPLCVTFAGSGLIGGYGYGVVQPISGEAVRLPHFAPLAERICDVIGLSGLRTVLPSMGLCGELDQATAHWPTEDGEVGFVSRIGPDTESMWAALSKSRRRSVRRARERELRVSAADVRVLPALLDLYAVTMERLGLLSVYEPEDLEFLFDPERNARSLVLAVEDGEQVLAIKVLGVGRGTAYSVMGLVSDEGRAACAGFLATWEVMTMLADRQVNLLDHGPGETADQAAAKRHWGAVPRPVRAISWSRGEPGS